MADPVYRRRTWGCNRTPSGGGIPGSLPQAVPPGGFPFDLRRQAAVRLAVQRCAVRTVRVPRKLRLRPGIRFEVACVQTAKAGAHTSFISISFSTRQMVLKSWLCSVGGIERSS